MRLELIGSTRVMVWMVGCILLAAMSGIGVDGVEIDQPVRMVDLSPDDPAGYFGLAERLLLEGTEGSERAVIELLVRGVYWGQQSGDTNAASSSCIALAGMVENESTGRWLWDLALLIDPSREGEWVRAIEIRDETLEAITLDASRCLYAIRNHRLPLGEELFGRAAVRNRIFEAGNAVGIGRERLVRVIEREIRSGDSDTCRGRLYIADRDEQGHRLICPDHVRGLGMCANDDDLRLFMRLEMALSGVEPGSWGSSVAMGFDGVVRLPTVDDLVRLFQVRADLAFYRDGRWVTMP